jgi:hypothetical protein
LQLSRMATDEFIFESIVLIKQIVLTIPTIPMHCVG